MDTNIIEVDDHKESGTLGAVSNYNKLVVGGMQFQAHCPLTQHHIHSGPRQLTFDL